MQTQTDPHAPASPRENDVEGWAGQLDLRWTAARRAALRTLVPDANADASEFVLLDAALLVDREAVLRRVFDNSHVLGLGFRRFHRVDLTLLDLGQLLPLLGAPCTGEGFLRETAAPELRTGRSPCGAPHCDYWREALHGLVSGLATAVYFSRVTSPAGGSEGCTDLLHLELQTPARYQAIPEAMQAPLIRAAEKMARVSPGSTVEYLGLREGELHLCLHQPRSGCSLDLNRALVATIQRLLPGLVVHDATPRAVLQSH